MPLCNASVKTHLGIYANGSSGIVPSRPPGEMGLDPTLRSFGVLERQSCVRSAQGRSEQSSVVGRVTADPDNAAVG